MVAAAKVALVVAAAAKVDVGVWKKSTPVKTTTRTNVYFVM